MQVFFKKTYNFTKTSYYSKISLRLTRNWGDFMKKKSKSKFILKIFAIVIALSMVFPFVMNAVESLGS